MYGNYTLYISWHLTLMALSHPGTFCRMLMTSDKQILFSPLMSAFFQGCWPASLSVAIFRVRMASDSVTVPSPAMSRGMGAYWVSVALRQ